MFSKGLRLILILTVPATMGLVVLAEPILNLLFGWGFFDADAVASTVPVLQISVLGLPFYSIVSLYTRGFHARQDMKTPLRASFHAVVVNLVFSVGLMIPFGIKGLAAAGVIASVWQWFYLWNRSGMPLPGVGASLIKVMVATAVMGVACWFAWEWVSDLKEMGWFTWEWVNDPRFAGKIESLLAVGGIIPAGMFIYATGLWFLQLEDLQAVKEVLFRRSGPES